MRVLLECIGVERTEAIPAKQAGPRSSHVASRASRFAWMVVRVLLALFLFVGALQLMKAGAVGFDLLKPGGVLVENAGSTFGLGWLGALLVLSGSPIAAVALALVAAGEESVAATQRFTEIQGFTMLTGSRLGAAFVVLVTAVVYAMRGGEGRRKAPVSTAVIALMTTALVYVPGFLLGLALLEWGPFRSVDLGIPSGFGGLIDLVYGDAVERAEDLPAWLVFLGGLVLLLVSFKVIDSVVPKLDEHTAESRLPWLRKKWPMFALGCAVALVVMSVSVALTILVPLVAKNYVRRDSIIPYIMGANITTLGDTLLAALALDSPGAIRITLASIAGTATVSLILLTFFYEQVRVGTWRLHTHFVKSPLHLVGFTAALFLIPVSVIVVSTALF
jgi:sodium-dependent phosphate cotransporter